MISDDHSYSCCQHLILVHSFFNVRMKATSARVSVSLSLALNFGISPLIPFWMVVTMRWSDFRHAMQIRAFVAPRIGAMTMGTIEHEQFVALVRGCASGGITNASAAPDAAAGSVLEYFAGGESDANRRQR